MGQFEVVLVIAMLINGVFVIPFGVLAKRAFEREGLLSPFLAAWSGIAMHGHALMTFAVSWLNQDSFYTPEFWAIFSGLILFITGGYIIFLGRKAYGDQSRVYGLKEDTLITHGIYTKSRNPQYFGYGLMFLGSAIASGSLLAFIFTAVFGFMVHVGITIIEEPHLERVFGQPFLDYKTKVARYFSR